MKLTDYLSQHGVTDGEFAVSIGVDRSSVSRMRRGITRPDWPTIERIIEATNGAVTANDFISPQSDEAA